MQYTTSNAEETQAIAADLATSLTGGGVILLSGELGAGKTTFTQGFAKALGITDKVISPTFILTRQYPIPNTPKTLYHIDLYRLENPSMIQTLGLDEIISNPNHITLIEWPERLSRLPSPHTNVKIEKTAPEERIIRVQKSE